MELILIPLELFELSVVLTVSTIDHDHMHKECP